MLVSETGEGKRGGGRRDGGTRGVLALCLLQRMMSLEPIGYGRLSGWLFVEGSGEEGRIGQMGGLVVVWKFVFVAIFLGGNPEFGYVEVNKNSCSHLLGIMITGCVIRLSTAHVSALPFVRASSDNHRIGQPANHQT